MARPTFQHYLPLFSFLGYIVPYECRGTAKFGCKLSALRLEHIPNNDPCSLSDEQASLGRALTACSSTDEYDFPFEAIHLSSIAVQDRCRPRRHVPGLARMQPASTVMVRLLGLIARTQFIR